MRCVDFERRWQELLDRRQPPQADDRLARHAAECDTCQRWLADQEAVFGDWSEPLSASVAESLAGDFAARVVCAVDADARRRRTERRVVAGLAIAAGLLFALLGTWSRNDVERRNSVIASAPSEANSQTESLVRTVPATVAEAATASFAAAPPSASTPAPETLPETLPGTWPETLLADASLEMSIDGWQRSWERLRDLPPEPWQSIEELADSFRPVANSLQAALSALRSTVPVGREPKLPRQDDVL